MTYISAYYKLYPEYFKYHKVPNRIIEETMDNIYNYSCDSNYLLIIDSDYPIAEKFLYKILSYFNRNSITKIVLNKQNLSKQFFLDQLNRFEKCCSSITNPWLTPYHYLELKPYQSWFDELNQDRTKLQIELSKIITDKKYILSPTEEYLNYIRLSTL